MYGSSKLGRREPAEGSAPPRIAAAPTYATFSGDGPALAETGVVDVPLEVWLRAIYGRSPAG
jgi:hypothetical protein